MLGVPQERLHRRLVLPLPPRQPGPPPGPDRRRVQVQVGGPHAPAPLDQVQRPVHPLGRVDRHRQRRGQTELGRRVLLDLLDPLAGVGAAARLAQGGARRDLAVRPAGQPLADDVPLRRGESSSPEDRGERDRLARGVPPSQPPPRQSPVAYVGAILLLIAGISRTRRRPGPPLAGC
jgi:hypothetical protein